MKIEFILKEQDSNKRQINNDPKGRKEPSDQKLLRIYEQNKNKYKYLFIRFTNNPERGTGINPKYSYDTPLGLYAYPFNSETINKFFKRDYGFSFGVDYKGIVIFGWNPSNSDGDTIVLNKDSDITQSQYDYYWNLLLSNEIKNAAPKHLESAKKQYENDFIQYANEAKNNKKFTEIFNITRNLAGQNAKEWTRDLRTVCNISCIIDNGTSLIHSAEPYQAVFFEPHKVSHIETLDNIINKELNKAPVEPGYFKFLREKLLDEPDPHHPYLKGNIHMSLDHKGNSIIKIFDDFCRLYLQVDEIQKHLNLSIDFTYNFYNLFLLTKLGKDKKHQDESSLKRIEELKTVYNNMTTYMQNIVELIQQFVTIKELDINVSTYTSDLNYDKFLNAMYESIKKNIHL